MSAVTLLNRIDGLDAESDRETLGKSEFWNKLLDEIVGNRQGGAKILIDAEDSKTGLAKTTAAVTLARALAQAFDYELKPADQTLSSVEYVQRYRKHPGKEQPSVLILDDLVGAGGGDARRAMAETNVNLTRAWELQRVKRVVTICTLADYSGADKRLKKLADFRVQCLREPFGAFRAYELGTHFDGSDGVKFRRLDPGSRFFFPDLPARGDPLYEDLAAKKDELIDSEYFDADELDDRESPDGVDEPLSDEEKELIREFATNTDATQRQIADQFEIDQAAVSKIKRGKL